MEFFSLGAALFLALLLLLYYPLSGKLPLLAGRRWMLLLAASLAWYALNEGWAVLIPVLSCLLLHRFCLLLDGIAADTKRRRAEAADRAERKRIRAEGEARKKRVLYIALPLVLAPLLLFKYVPWDRLGFSLLLPLGISFYTFTSLSYLLDVYGEKIPAERSPGKVMLCVLWFPALLQGPIGRFEQLEKTLTEERSWDRERAGRSLLLLAYGLLKKYAVADMLFRHIGAVLDEDLASVPGMAILFSILLYSAWQYADFSGGIDMILGISGLFGIDLAPNFRRPYFAVSLGDFWRRWHISLGQFMRDYVFYPLALTKPLQKLGKRAGSRFSGSMAVHVTRTLPACIANLFVFALVGIWHGPKLHFLLWGLYNGLVIALSDLTKPFWTGLTGKLRLREDSRGMHLFRILRTFFIVNIGWYFDRIEDAAASFSALFRTFAAFSPAESLACLKTRYLVSEGDPFSAVGSFAVAALSLALVFGVSLFEERSALTGKNETVADRILERRGGLFLSLFVLLHLVLMSFVFSESAGGFFYAGF